MTSTSEDHSFFCPVCNKLTGRALFLDLSFVLHDLTLTIGKECRRESMGVDRFRNAIVIGCACGLVCIFACFDPAERKRPLRINFK
jgi:hypothetical protein